MKTKAHFACWTTARSLQTSAYRDLYVDISIVHSTSDLRQFDGLICCADESVSFDMLVECISEAALASLPVVIWASEQVVVPTAVNGQPIALRHSLRQAVLFLKTFSAAPTQAT